MATSSGSKPGVKAMERVTNKARSGKPSGKPGEKAMEREVNPVKRGKAGANPANVGGTDFYKKRASIRSKKK
jgi:hypothetical protein